MGFKYADVSEVTNHSLIHSQKKDNPEYANIFPWAQNPQLRSVHYATLGRALHTRKSEFDHESDKLYQSESIPDILQTISISSKKDNANVIVNSLSGIEG